MLKRGLMTFFLILCGIASTSGQNRITAMKRWTFGGEITYDATFYSSKFQYFISPEGFRENISSSKFGYDTDSEVNLHAGYNINQIWNLSLHIGYTEVGDFHKVVPFSIRATRFFNDNPLNDRWFTFVDAGSGISLKEKPQEIACGKIGGGYRLSLSRSAKLDILMAIRVVYTHPEISYYGIIYSPQKMFRNDGMICSLIFGTNISF